MSPVGFHRSNFVAWSLLDLSANTKLSERESQFEQQINEYQNSINQTTRDAEQVRTELKQIQDEFLQKENENKKLLDQLQQKYDQLQADLKDRGTFINEIRSLILSLLLKNIRRVQRSANENHNTNNRSKIIKRSWNKRRRIWTIDKRNCSHYAKKSSPQRNSWMTRFNHWNKITNGKSANFKHSWMNCKTEVRSIPLLDGTSICPSNRIDRTQNMASSERESHFETQIKEYQAKRDQALQETQDVRAELVKLQGEKESQEKKLNEIVQTLTDDFTKQTESFQTQLAELENQSLFLSAAWTRFESIHRSHQGQRAISARAAGERIAIQLRAIERRKRSTERTTSTSAERTSSSNRTTAEVRERKASNQWANTTGIPTASTLNLFAITWIVTCSI